MTADSFFDTNIFLYAASNAPDDAEKKRRAVQLILDRSCALSAQVLQEFIANAHRKKSLGLGESNIEALLEFSRHAPVQPVTRDLVEKACQICLRFGLSHWDATIVAAARELGCRTLYSEDFNHGQDYDGVVAVNPFLNS